MDYSVKCGVCGKEISSIGESALSIHFFERGLWVNHEVEKAMKVQYGEFDPYTQYVCCYECFLKAFGFKPGGILEQK